MSERAYRIGYEAGLKRAAEMAEKYANIYDDGAGFEEDRVSKLFWDLVVAIKSENVEKQ